MTFLSSVCTERGQVKRAFLRLGTIHLSGGRSNARKKETRKALKKTTGMCTGYYYNKAHFCISI